jgi:hypothetical protein
VTTFYLGSHMPNWLAKTDVPLFVSRVRLAGRKSLPRARGRWALDSGGFSELSLRGEWTVSAGTYAAEVRRFRDEIGQLAWAAAQDWMCEPQIIAKTGLSIEEHQRRTVANYLELREIAPDLPWVPVVQGWRAEDYLRHADDYAAAGVDLTTQPLVGLGTICRRQQTSEAEWVIRRLMANGLRLHGFGLKLGGLQRIGPLIASADSMAWSFRARKARRPLCGSRAHASCANCLPFALGWREKVLALLTTNGETRPVQLDLGLREAA